MAIEIKRPLVSDLFAIGSSVGANGNNAVAPAIVSGSYQPTQGDPNSRGQQPQGGGPMDALSNVGGKVAGRALNNYLGGAGAAGASTGSGVGYGLGQSLVSGGIGSATYAGTAGAAGFGAGAGAGATGVGYGLGGALSSGAVGGATYAGAGGAVAGGTAAGAGAGAAGAGAAGGAAAGGAASGAAAAGPFAAIAAAIIMNEQDSKARGLRREGNDYYKDLATGKVLQQDINGKWAPMTDSIFGEKSGLGNDQRFFGDVMTLDFKSAAKNFKKSSLATGFGLWG